MKCAPKIWKKFSPKQKRMFEMMVLDMNVQSLMVHPKTKLPARQWDTIRHNAAIRAAWILEDLNVS